jgi:protein gp37
MYEWVTHTWSPIIGCVHQCQYCYVKAFRDQPQIPTLREDFPNLGNDRTIFVGHLCDMFGSNVPPRMVARVLSHCQKFPDNFYVFQTKDPNRFLDFEYMLQDMRYSVGTTIETNRYEITRSISQTLDPLQRADALSFTHGERFVTIEPILKFDLIPFVDLIQSARPAWVNIGADSKGHGLSEPTANEVADLVAELFKRDIPIRKKTNLNRLTYFPKETV